MRTANAKRQQGPGRARGTAARRHSQAKVHMPVCLARLRGSSSRCIGERRKPPDRLRLHARRVRSAHESMRPCECGVLCAGQAGSVLRRRAIGLWARVLRRRAGSPRQKIRRFLRITACHWPQTTPPTACRVPGCWLLASLRCRPTRTQAQAPSPLRSELEYGLWAAL